VIGNGLILEKDFQRIAVSASGEYVRADFSQLHDIEKVSTVNTSKVGKHKGYDSMNLANCEPHVGCTCFGSQIVLSVLMWKRDINRCKL
jgi:hypothetical protein